MTGRVPILPLDGDLLDAACRNLGLRTLVLFGSRATGEPPPAPESDIDVAVTFPASTQRPGFFEVHQALSPVFGAHDLDVVFLSASDPLFCWEIMRRGRLLWGDEVEHLEDRALAFRMFVDSADLRSLERTLFEKRMAFIRSRLRVSA